MRLTHCERHADCIKGNVDTGLVVSLGVAFVLIGKWSSGFDDGDTFPDLDRSAAELSTALKLGIDREDYGWLVRQMALEIDLAGRRVKSPEGQKLIRLLRFPPEFPISGRQEPFRLARSSIA